MINYPSNLQHGPPPPSAMSGHSSASEPSAGSLGPHRASYGRGRPTLDAPRGPAPNSLKPQPWSSLRDQNWQTTGNAAMTGRPGLTLKRAAAEEARQHDNEDKRARLQDYDYSQDSRQRDSPEGISITQQGGNWGGDDSWHSSRKRGRV